MYTNIFDTHAHYDDEAFDDDRESLILSLKDRGVVGIVSCGCDIASTVANQSLSHSFDDFYMRMDNKKMVKTPARMAFLLQYCSNG